MNYFKNQLINIPFYYIKGNDDCYFVNDKLIYNVETKRFSKLRLSCQSLGFNINGNFVLLNNITKIKAEKLSKNL